MLALILDVLRISDHPQELRLSEVEKSYITWIQVLIDGRLWISEI